MIGLINVLTMYFNFCLLYSASNSIEFKIRVISNTTLTQTFSVPPIRMCNLFKAQNELFYNSTITSALSIYRPILSSEKKGGFFITYHKLISLCSMNFWGVTTKTIINDSPLDITQVPPLFLLKIRNKFKTQEKPIYDFNYQETVSETSKMYDCFWMQEDNVWETVYANVRAIQVVWALDQSLLQPLISNRCYSFNQEGICALTNHSELIHEVSQLDTTCKITRVLTVEGLLSFNNQDESYEFASIKSNFMLSFKRSSVNSPPICKDGKDIKIYSSNEGHLFSVATRLGVSDIDNLENKINQHLNKRSKRGLSIKRPFKHFWSSPRLQSFPEPPELDSLYSTNHTHSINKRSSLWEYQEHQRLQVLSEHQAWGFSQLQMKLNTLSLETLSQSIDAQIESCVERENFIRLAASIPDPYPLVSVLMGDESIVAYRSSLSHILVKQGVPVGGVREKDLDFPIWCNGTLLVHFKLPDDGQEHQGWLVNGKGLILHNLLTGDHCLTNQAPSEFLIPTLKEGSYNIYSKTHIFQRASGGFNPHFKLHFMDIAKDSGMETLVGLEAHLIAGMRLGTSSKDKSRFQDIWTNPAGVSSSYLAKLTGNFLIPCITGSWGLMIIVILLLFCCIGNIKKSFPRIFS